MFNIKKKIYVAHEDEYVDFMHERCIVLHSHFKSLETVDNIEEETDLKGVVGCYNNYEMMLDNKFDGLVTNFHDFLNKEENLLIIASRKDYARLYMEMQLELESDFGVTEENLEHMRDLQRFKDFFLGSKEMRKFCYPGKRKDSAFDRVCKTTKKTYKPTGRLFRNVTQLPLEVIFALYKWGNISKTQANTKIANVATPMLISEIDIIIESGRIALTHSPAILQEYLGDDSIKVTDDCIKAIFADPLLLKLFSGEDSDVDLGDAEEVVAVKRLCSIIISKYEELELQPEVDQGELDFFFELYEKKDIDVVDKARVNLINTGMVATRQGKFNTGLIMAV